MIRLLRIAARLATLLPYTVLVVLADEIPRVLREEL